MPDDDKRHSHFRVKSEGFRIIARGFEKVQVRVVLQTLPATHHRFAQRLSKRTRGTDCLSFATRILSPRQNELRRYALIYFRHQTSSAAFAAVRACTSITPHYNMPSQCCSGRAL